MDRAKSILALRVKLATISAWEFLAEDDKEELVKVLMSVHNGAIDSAYDAVHSTIDETRASIEKLKI
jgi:hypothetical protein